MRGSTLPTALVLALALTGCSESGEGGDGTDIRAGRLAAAANAVEDGPATCPFEGTDELVRRATGEETTRATAEDEEGRTRIRCKWAGGEITLVVDEGGNPTPPQGHVQLGQRDVAGTMLVVSAAPDRRGELEPVAGELVLLVARHLEG